MSSKLVYVKGDIFMSPAEVIVNPVNTVGIMGKRLALAFKQKYPKMFEKYQSCCDDGTFSVGKLLLIEEDDYRILLFPTKKHWRGTSKIEYINFGLQKFIDTYKKKIYIPLLSLALDAG